MKKTAIVFLIMCSLDLRMLYPWEYLAPAGMADTTLSLEGNFDEFPAIVDMAEQVLIHVDMDIEYVSKDEMVNSWKELLALMIKDTALHEFLKRKQKEFLIAEWQKWMGILENVRDTLPYDIDIEQFAFSARCAIDCYRALYISYLNKRTKKPGYLVEKALKKIRRAQVLIKALDEGISQGERSYLLVFYSMEILYEDQILIPGHKQKMLAMIPGIVDRLNADNIISNEDKKMLLNLMRVRDDRGFTSTAEFYKYHITEFFVGRPERKKMILGTLLDIHYRIARENMLMPEYRMRRRLSLLNGMVLGLFKIDGLARHTGLVQKRIMPANLIRVYTAVKDRMGGDIREIAYDYGGADIITPLLLSDARVIRIRDLLPFMPRVPPDDKELASLKNIFFMNFAVSGFTHTELLWVIGHAKPMIYWKLEVLGAAGIRDPRKGDESRGEDPDAYYIEFSWSYDGDPLHETKRVIIYKEITLTKESVERNSDDLAGADIYLRKAALRAAVSIPDIMMHPRYIITLKDEGEIEGYTRLPIAELPGYPRGAVMFAHASGKDYVDPGKSYIYERIQQEKRQAEPLWHEGDTVQQVDLVTGGYVGDKRVIDFIDISAERVHVQGDLAISYISFGVLNRRFVKIIDGSS